jgi:hypothetical protein
MTRSDAGLGQTYPPIPKLMYPAPVPSQEGQFMHDCDLGGGMGMSGNWLEGRCPPVTMSGLVSLSPVLVGPLPDRLDFLWVAVSNLLLMKTKSNGVSMSRVLASAPNMWGE